MQSSHANPEYGPFLWVYKWIRIALLISIFSMPLTMLGAASDSLLTDGRIGPLTAEALSLFSLPWGYGVHYGFAITGSMLGGMLCGLVLHAVFVGGIYGIVMKLIRFIRANYEK